MPPHRTETRASATIRYNRRLKETLMAGAQTYKNHGRIYPMYHVWAFIPLVAYFLWSLYRLRYGLTVDSIMSVVLAIGLLALFTASRVMVLTVQDRVIRLEMQLRLRGVLPPDL